MSLFVFSGRLMSRCRESRIAPATAASLGHGKAVAAPGEVVQQLSGLGVVHNGSDRHWNGHRYAFASRAIAALAMPAPLALVLRVIAQVQQRVVVFAGLEHDVAA